MNYFGRSKKFEERKKHLVEAFLKEKLGLRVLKDISGEKDGIAQDKDYVAKTSFESPWIRIESKLRSKKYADKAREEILIETMSSVENQTPGWIEKSKADYLAYLWLEREGVEGYILNLPKLQEWWKKNAHRYTEYILAPNPPKEPRYHTENYIVPIKDLPDELFIYRPPTTNKLYDFFWGKNATLRPRAHL